MFIFSDLNVYTLAMAHFRKVLIIKPTLRNAAHIERIATILIKKPNATTIYIAIDTLQDYTIP